MEDAALLAISGLQSPVLGSKLQFSALHSEGVQILNYKKHWICISTVGCCPGHVKVYDSLYPFPSSSAIRQICNLVQTRESTLVVQMMDVQTQSGGDDCGLFAIAISFALCSGKNPCEIEFRQDVMRSHLVSCFCIGKLSHFPSKPRKVLKDAKHEETLSVFCLCRMPEDKKGMVQCVACQEWFHRRCQKIPHAVFTKKAPWRCSSCTM